MTVRRSGRTRSGRAQPGTAEEVRWGASHRVDLFDFLDDAARTDFVATAGTRVVPAGGRIYTQDDRHRVMYRIVSGRAWLSYSRADGRELLYLLLGPGECLGISALVDGRGLPQSATARTEVTLQVITQDAFERLRRRHTCIDDAIMKSMLRDIRLLITSLAEAALDDLPARVARRLLALAAPSPGGDLVVELPQAELAAVFGVSRQTLNKALKDFEEDGLVRRTYGKVLLVDLPGLETRANWD